MGSRSRDGDGRSPVVRCGTVGAAYGVIQDVAPPLLYFIVSSLRFRRYEREESRDCNVSQHESHERGDSKIEVRRSAVPLVPLCHRSPCGGEGKRKILTPRRKHSKIFFIENYSRILHRISYVTVYSVIKSRRHSSLAVAVIPSNLEARHVNASR